MRPTLRLWLRTGATIALVDFCFASVLSVFFYHATFARLWQGVASVPFGAQAIGGGDGYTLLGIACHITTAFTWAGVFVVMLRRWPALQRAVTTPAGVFAVAAVYGPCIWLVMSLLVIPFFTGKPPSFTYRWWIQIAGHIFFVGLPIVWTASRPFAKRAAAA